MTDPHDDLDSWLRQQVEPLPPPPGTLGLIRKRARRRKTRQVLISAASAGTAAVVIVLAVVALPKIAPGFHSRTSPVASSGHTRTPAQSGTPAPPTSEPITQTPPAQPTVPPNFAATSVTFVGPYTGWVIGQAGTPGHCATQYCTSLAGTSDYGGTWHGVPAPETGPPLGGTGVSQVRFQNLQDGWAFGPQLWATHDGGQDWAKVNTDGMRVISLETVHGEAFAVWAQCTGSGIDFAAGCTRFYLYESPASQDQWARVRGVTYQLGSAGGSPGSATVVLSGTTGYFYTTNDMMFGGPVTGGAAWTTVSLEMPCETGQAQPDGRPSAGQLAVASPGNLAIACPAGTPGGTTTQETIYTSSGNPQRWQKKGTITIPAPATSLAATAGGTLVLGTDQGILVSIDDGADWQPASVQAPPPGGFSYVGMTTAQQGVAVPEQAGEDAVWITHNGGQTWQESQITNP